MEIQNVKVKMTSASPHTHKVVARPLATSIFFLETLSNEWNQNLSASKKISRWKKSSISTQPKKKKKTLKWRREKKKHLRLTRKQRDGTPLPLYLPSTPPPLPPLAWPLPSLKHLKDLQDAKDRDAERVKVSKAETGQVFDVNPPPPPPHTPPSHPPSSSQNNSVIKQRIGMRSHRGQFSKRIYRLISKDFPSSRVQPHPNAKARHSTPERDDSCSASFLHVHN